MNEAEIACGGFVVACCQSARAFELVEAAFDLVAKSIDEAVYQVRCLAIGPGGDDGCAARTGYGFADVV